MKKTTMICAGFIFVLGLSAQPRQVVGKLTLFNTFPLTNVEITTKKSKTSAFTDSDGMFMIEADEKDVLIIKTKAFQAVSRRITDKDKPIDVNMIFKNTPKNREMAVSQNFITKEDLEYGLKNLQYMNNDYCNYSDVFVLIRNKFSDVDVRVGPNGTPAVFVRRGTKSMYGITHTLYYIDGVRVQDIAHVNPCEIAKIAVLKDGAAAKFGAGSSNGAVEIKTKEIQ